MTRKMTQRVAIPNSSKTCSATLQLFCWQPIFVERRTIFKLLHTGTYVGVVDVEQNDTGNAQYIVEQRGGEEQTAPTPRRVRIFPFLKHVIVPGVSEIHEQDQLQQ